MGVTGCKGFIRQVSHKNRKLKLLSDVTKRVTIQWATSRSKAILAKTMAY